MRFVIYGTGGMGREILRPLKLAVESADSADNEILFCDDYTDENIVNGIKVVRSLKNNDRFILGVGESDIRKKLHERCANIGAIPFGLASKSSIIYDDSVIGAGFLLMDNAFVSTNVRIGVQFQANVQSCIMHDCIVGDYVTLGPKACVNGNVHIGDGAYIGAGAIIKQGTPDNPLIIGAGATVGMGAVVTKNVPPGAVVVGNPAKAR